MRALFGEFERKIRRPPHARDVNLAVRVHVNSVRHVVLTAADDFDPQPLGSFRIEFADHHVAVSVFVTADRHRITKIQSRVNIALSVDGYVVNAVRAFVVTEIRSVNYPGR